jgi:1,4-alpha-glucan branching enzyme
MPDHLGGLCLVLHGHLPYVLHHGAYPHGEAWLFEAAAETYLPILELLQICDELKIRPAITIGLTPVLLEQLASSHFKNGFVGYLQERAARAAGDGSTFSAANEPHMVLLAGRWQAWYRARLEQFESIDRNIPAQFGAAHHAGAISLLTSNATHAYMPLLLNDEMIRAQISCGVATTERHLGVRPSGMWLPECAYRPGSTDWVPPVLYNDPRGRAGIEQLVAEAGINHFFVDHHVLANGHALGIRENGKLGDHGPLREMNETQLYWDQKRGWGSPLEPALVASWAGGPEVAAFARHPRVSEQVWSGIIGYPGAPEYLDFHRKQPEAGLRYHRVTSQETPSDEKLPYDPALIEARLQEHAAHFCNVVREVLGGHKFFANREGVVVAPFDAELFGHWWFEGPRFLRQVLEMLANDPQITLMTTEEALHHATLDKVVRLPEGSWGERGDHSVWLNDKTRWMWESEYRAEGRFLHLLHTLPWRENEQVREMLTRAARELLLLQASDWPFVIHSGGAVDYGIQRFAGHCTRFDRLTQIAEAISRGEELTELQNVQIAEAALHDEIFAEIDLEWWMG